MSDDKWKEIVDKSLHKYAQQALNNCDYMAFLGHSSNENNLLLLRTVIDRALDCKKMESAFIYAYAATRTNNYHEYEIIEYILKYVDLDRLFEEGDELPRRDRYRLYRGISGAQTPEIIKGYSWTDDVQRAHWFAMRYAEFGNPSIYTTVVQKKSILFYTNGRSENEFVLNPKYIEVEFLENGDQSIADKQKALDKVVSDKRLNEAKRRLQ